MGYNKDDESEERYSDDAMQGSEGVEGVEDGRDNTDSLGQDLGTFNSQQFSFDNMPDYSNLDGLSSLFNMGNYNSPDINQQQTDYTFPGFHSTPGVDYEQAFKGYVPEDTNDNSMNLMGVLSKVFSSAGSSNTPQQTQQVGNPNAKPQDMLTKLLGSLGSISGIKGLFSIGSALAEGKQNKQNAANTQRIVQQQQARQDPFASQRPFYQQQLQQSVTNPYSSPIVAEQLKAMQALQARKDAAAGRRSNTAFGNPALMAEAAKAALADRNSLMAPAGANINPNQIGLQDLLGASQQQTQGTMSPLMSAIGKILQGNEIEDRKGAAASNDSTLNNLLKVLSQMSGG